MQAVARDSIRSDFELTRGNLLSNRESSRAEVPVIDTSIGVDHSDLKSLQKCQSSSLLEVRSIVVTNKAGPIRSMNRKESAPIISSIGQASFKLNLIGKDTSQLPSSKKTRAGSASRKLLSITSNSELVLEAG